MPKKQLILFDQFSGAKTSTDSTVRGTNNTEGRENGNYGRLTPGNKLRGIDLFCGIGGFRLAMQKNNVDCVFSSDIDKFAQQTYKANFNEVPAGDITKIESKDIPSFDILAAGFPCQPFSYAGEKKGFEDTTRGTLFFDICRILKYHKPAMVFLENVKGLV